MFQSDARDFPAPDFAREGAAAALLEALPAGFLGPAAEGRLRFEGLLLVLREGVRVAGAVGWLLLPPPLPLRADVEVCRLLERMRSLTEGPEVPGGTDQPNISLAASVAVSGPP